MAIFIFKRGSKHNTDKLFSSGFEQHFIRGQKKMKLRVCLALLVMLAMAFGRVKEKQKDNLRSLVQAA